MTGPPTKLPITVEVHGADTPAKQRIAEEAMRAIDTFIRLGSASVENACNAERLRLRDLITTQSGVLGDFGLASVSQEQALTELSEPFTLHRPPLVIRLDLSQPLHPDNRAIPMECDYCTVDPFAFAIIRLYTAHFDCNSFAGVSGDRSVAELIFHEMLHLCGDIRHDGIIRHNLVGIEAVKELARTEGG